MSPMRRMRGLLTTAIAAATTGAALTYAFLATRPPVPAPLHQFSPPPELPSSSKLLIPNINLTFLPDPDIRPGRCDYGPLWECIVNGNGGCEGVEQELRVCLDRAGKPEPTRVVTSQCDYAPLWECIVNGNGGCEGLEADLRNCLENIKSNS